MAVACASPWRFVSYLLTPPIMPLAVSWVPFCLRVAVSANTPVDGTGWKDRLLAASAQAKGNLSNQARSSVRRRHTNRSVSDQ